MQTVTIPKTEYEILKRRNRFYDRALGFFTDKRFAVEDYTEDRIKEFVNQDQIDKKTKEKIKKILQS